MKIVKWCLGMMKNYWLTLLTLVIILCLTFCDFTGVERTESVIQLDKVVHFIMYSALCTVFWFESFKLNINVSNRLMLLLAVVVPALFSGLMEYLQSVMTSYRDGDFDDFIFNTIGVIFAALFSLFVTKPYMKRRLEKQQ